MVAETRLSGPTLPDSGRQIDTLSPVLGLGSLAQVKGISAAVDLLATSLRGARVLIVDDDALQCAHLAQIVKEWDAEPFTAQTLADALRLHKEARPTWCSSTS